MSDSDKYNSCNSYLITPYFDIVVPWVNWSHEGFIKARCEAGDIDIPMPGTYDELRYLLRSVFTQDLGYWTLRRIYIVHSDLHPPPDFLKPNKQLRFIPHSAIDSSGSKLLLHRDTINISLHRIPGLARYFLYLEDDYLLLSPRHIRDEIERHINSEIIVFRRNIPYWMTFPNLDIDLRLWFRASRNSAELLQVMDSSNHTICCEHFSRFYDRDILDDLEKQYPTSFAHTRSLGANPVEEDHKHVCLNCLYTQYLCYHLKFKEIVGLPLLGMVRLEQGFKIWDKRNKCWKQAPTRTNSELNKDLLGQLKSCESKSLACIQGYGISEEIWPGLRKVYKNWVENIFPTPSIFEHKEKLKLNTFTIRS